MDIPDEFSDDEKINRLVFHKMNFKKNGKDLSPNAFQPPRGSDEVSVLRIDFSTPDFCKFHGKSMQNPSARRNFWGFGILNYNEVLESGAVCVYTPMTAPQGHFVKSHADILFTKLQAGEPGNSEERNAQRKLASKVRTYEDEHPEVEKWLGAYPI
jgi:hypothetical protein